MQIEGAGHACNELSSQMPACLVCIIMLRFVSESSIYDCTNSDTGRGPQV